MHRFYCPLKNYESANISIISKEEINHIQNVLRLEPGQDVEVFNGLGNQAFCSILSISKIEIKLKVISTIQNKLPKPYIILACAVPKKNKFEFIVEKATELGVDEIIPIKTQRTEISLTGERLQKKISRYKTVAINASKQCNRSIIPKIHQITKFDKALELLSKNNKDSHIIIPSLIDQTQPLKNSLKLIKKPALISILIGPEGDFSPNEYLKANNIGCIPVSLGKTILKVETAAISTLSFCRLYYNNEY